MDIMTLSLWVLTAGAFALSVKKDRRRTMDSIKMAVGMMKHMIGEIMAILFLIGLILTFMPPDLIKTYLGGSDTFTSAIISAVVGSVTLIPAFVAFPLVASFLEMGIHIIPAVAFLTTLTMVGIVTMPLERQEFGTKFALIRNGLSFVFAIIISIAMGVFL